MRLSVVIPAYNEEDRLGETLRRVLAFLAGLEAYEVLVVDDGSTDGTAALAARFASRGVQILRNEENRGKGYSVRRGMLAARLDLLLFSDADLSTPIEEVERLAAPVLKGEADGAIGSRAAKGARIEVPQPFYRVFMGKVFNRMVRLLALPGYADTQCGFKLFRREVAQAVFRRQTFDGFSFDVEALFIARRLGYRIVEVPVRWIHSPQTKVHALRDSARMFADLLRLRWRALRGRYT